MCQRHELKSKGWAESNVDLGTLNLSQYVNAKRKSKQREREYEIKTTKSNTSEIKILFTCTRGAKNRYQEKGEKRLRERISHTI